jgi:CBS domain-containing protein
MVAPDTDVMEALRLLTTEHRQTMLLVVAADGNVKGIVTKTDILRALKDYGTPTGPDNSNSVQHDVKEHSPELS